MRQCSLAQDTWPAADKGAGTGLHWRRPDPLLGEHRSMMVLLMEGGGLVLGLRVPRGLLLPICLVSAEAHRPPVWASLTQMGALGSWRAPSPILLTAAGPGVITGDHPMTRRGDEAGGRGAVACLQLPRSVARRTPGCSL